MCEYLQDFQIYISPVDKVTGRAHHLQGFWILEAPWAVYRKATITQASKWRPREERECSPRV